MSQIQKSHASLKVYIVGFMLSILLTLEAYLLVVKHLLNGSVLLLAIGGLAIIQLIVQLVCFLHLGQEMKPKWNVMTFAFMSLLVFVIVVGSLWIMANLDYHHGDHLMTPQETDQQIIQDEGIKQ